MHVSCFFTVFCHWQMWTLTSAKMGNAILLLQNLKWKSGSSENRRIYFAKCQSSKFFRGTDEAGVMWHTLHWCNLQEPTRFLMYSLILSCRCIRSTLRSLYCAWMVLQWPISSTNSLDKTPCWRKTASWSLGCMFTDFTAEILPPLCKNLLPLHKNRLKRQCV